MSCRAWPGLLGTAWCTPGEDLPSRPRPKSSPSSGPPPWVILEWHLTKLQPHPGGLQNSRCWPFFVKVTEAAEQKRFQVTLSPAPTGLSVGTLMFYVRFHLLKEFHYFKKFENPGLNNSKNFSLSTPKVPECSGPSHQFLGKETGREGRGSGPRSGLLEDREASCCRSGRPTKSQLYYLVVLGDEGKSFFLSGSNQLWFQAGA